MEVKGTLFALVSKYSSIKPQDLANPSCLSNLVFIDEASKDYYIKDGYTLVGQAEVTFKPVGMEDMLKNKIEALKCEAAAIRAESMAKTTKIEAQIQNLLAIGFDEKAVFDAPTDESDIPF